MLSMSVEEDFVMRVGVWIVSSKLKECRRSRNFIDELVGRRRLILKSPQMVMSAFGNVLVVWIRRSSRSDRKVCMQAEGERYIVRMMFCVGLECDLGWVCDQRMPVHSRILSLVNLSRSRGEEV